MVNENVRRVLIAIAVKARGNWDIIYEKVCKKEFPSDEEIDEIMSKLKSKAITIMDKEYPENLRNIYKPPFVLFYYGDISLISDYQKCISVVGSRNHSTYGAEATKAIVSDIAKDYHIVSGLALGIDAIAHETCLNSNGKTVAVLPSGIDYCYPQTNHILYKKIKENHLLLSEYPGRTVAEPDFCRFRNRIVAGLSKMVLVTDAHEKSGTLITIGYALNSNIEVGAVPHPIGSYSECNRMIKDGALLIDSGDDIRIAMDNYKK